MRLHRLLLAGWTVELIFGSAAHADPRKSILLDGPWQIAQGKMDERPAEFACQIPVPGLLDMATPPFEEVGKKSTLREAFWYRRTFTVQQGVPAVALLKVHKATFGTHVWLNNEDLGEHQACFTPGYFDARSALKGNGQENEIVIRVGASPEALPPTVPTGFDFEKIVYLPGIYDSVELILTGSPHVVRVQAVPDLAAGAVRVVADIASDREREVTLKCEVFEARSGAPAGSVESRPTPVSAGKETVIDLTVPIKNPRLWSPEDPFLYELRVSTGADELQTRFGMRSFRFDKAGGRAILNGKPYYLRGTNVCIFRFFEDPNHGDKAWDETWVRKLHRAFRDMHWNSARYCIGFPPEMWYRIADEEGFLIQDEFPIWGGAELKGPTAESLIPQYREWMQERWNHPSVVIWDAQNETVTPETGKVIQAVRSLDLSHRPWDNGWSPPQSPDDCYEAHPYFWINPAARLGELPLMPASALGNPTPNKDGNAIIINEYGWLWLNRDGTPTKLTEQVYANLVGAEATPAQRRLTYARLFAANTELFRSQRRFAGVLHFCGLSYSRPGGQTCDDFTDLDSLQIEPTFRKYVRDAFAPVGVMLDFWDEELLAGQDRKVPVVVINDLYEACKPTVKIRMSQGDKTVQEATQTLDVEALGKGQTSFDLAVPQKPGRYELVAEMRIKDGDPVRSWREFNVITAEQKTARDGIAVGKPVTASSALKLNGESFPAENAVDGRRTTRWSSEFADPQWIAIDLGETTSISRVELYWETAYASHYAIQVSLDGQKWSDVYKTDAGAGNKEVIRFQSTPARWVRMLGTQRKDKWGYSLWEISVFP